MGCAAAGLLCSGDFYEASFVVDYVFNKHYDLYAGVNYSEVTDGLANGFRGALQFREPRSTAWHRDCTFLACFPGTDRSRNGL